MNKPVLVLVMSEKCGACQNFKRKALPELEKELKNDSRFKFVSLDFPDMTVPNNKDGKEFHPELRNGFVEFFPTFLLFPGNLWNDKNSKLKGVAKHDLKINPNVDYSKNSIISWIEETLKTNPLFINSNIDINDKIKNTNPYGSYAKLGDDGYYSVPTYGTYNIFKGTKPDNDEM